MRFIIAFFLTFSSLYATPNDNDLRKMIGHMLIVGFDEAMLSPTSPILEEIQRYELGGVILFDRFYNDKNRTKNISSPAQLKALTSMLKQRSKKPLLICVDQEGGKVARLKPSYGFEATPSAYAIAQHSLENAHQRYTAMAQMLVGNGINCNFAPDVDIAINPHNKVIVGLERSYGKEPSVVANYALAMLQAFDQQNIIGVLKHFPGHGSSKDDSHLGFVDVSNTWSAQELEPYKKLMSHKETRMIMSAHVFNATLDSTYPATLSYATNTTLLRKTLGFKGVLVSDDLHMKAIHDAYSLQQTVTLAINSGVDMLLFGNQLAHTSTKEIVETILANVKNGTIPVARIMEANERIATLHHERRPL